MASNIDPTLPVTGNPTTLSVRTNFAAAKAEIEAAQDAISALGAPYSHPANHPASIITQDASNRFVTDAEKAAWDGKQTAGTYATGTGSAEGVNTGDQDLSGKQEVLVSGTNIKTVNGSSLLGSGDVAIAGGGATTQTITGPEPSPPAAGSVALYAARGVSEFTAVPVMTSATAPSGVASASSEYVTAPAFNAFNAVSNGWLSNGGALPHWLQYQFPGSTEIAGYSIAPWDADTFSARCPSAWTVQGSNNGTAWTTIDTKSGQGVWAVGVTKTFMLPSIVSYVYYRLHITANNLDTYTGLRKFQLLGTKDALWVMLADGTKAQVT